MALNHIHEPFTNLRRLMVRRPPVARCELCGGEIGAVHEHLFEPVQRKLLCSCQACAFLFSNGADTKLKRVPRRVRRLPAFQMTDGQWDSLMIPIEMAFFFHSTPAGKTIAMYPSPAGATESLLALDSWNDIVLENPELSSMEPDVEALLVNRSRSGPEPADGQYYIVPIDECFRLVGLIRTHWRGFSGGSQVWEEIARFFADLDKKTTPETVNA